MANIENGFIRLNVVITTVSDWLGLFEFSNKLLNFLSVLAGL